MSAHSRFEFVLSLLKRLLSHLALEGKRHWQPNGRQTEQTIRDAIQNDTVSCVGRKSTASVVRTERSRAVTGRPFLLWRSTARCRRANGSSSERPYFIIPGGNGSKVLATCLMDTRQCRAVGPRTSSAKHDSRSIILLGSSEAMPQTSTQPDTAFLGTESSQAGYMSRNHQCEAIYHHARL